MRLIHVLRMSALGTPADQSPAWERPFTVHSYRSEKSGERQQWVDSGPLATANISH